MNKIISRNLNKIKKNLRSKGIGYQSEDEDNEMESSQPMSNPSFIQQKNQFYNPLKGSAKHKRPGIGSVERHLETSGDQEHVRVRDAGGGTKRALGRGESTEPYRKMEVKGEPVGRRFEKGKTVIRSGYSPPIQISSQNSKENIVRDEVSYPMASKLKVVGMSSLSRREEDGGK
jgi:hypothetical protein